MLLLKLTDMNYESLKIDIMKLITKDHLLPYIIETLVEKCILHHRYINLYVGIIKDIHNGKIKLYKSNDNETIFLISFKNSYS